MDFYVRKQSGPKQFALHKHVRLVPPKKGEILFVGHSKNCVFMEKTYLTAVLTLLIILLNTSTTSIRKEEVEMPSLG